MSAFDAASSASSRREPGVPVPPSALAQVRSFSASMPFARAPAAPARGDALDSRTARAVAIRANGHRRLPGVFEEDDRGRRQRQNERAGAAVGGDVGGLDPAEIADAAAAVLARVAVQGLAPEA